MDRNDDKAKATGAGTAGGAVVGGVAGGAAAGAAAGGMTGPVGAAVGAAVGAGIGAMSGHSAASSKESGGLGSNTHSDRTTVIGAFDDPAAAQRAVDRLTASGFDRDDVHLQGGSGGSMGTGSMATSPEPAAQPHEHKGFFARLFGMDDDDDVAPQRQSAYAGHASTYDEAVRRGSSVVVVDVEDDTQAERAANLLHELGAVDVDERARQWQSEGWKPQAGQRQDLGTTGRTQDMTGRQEGVLDVVEEQLQVGKRTLDKGGVRVVQRISSRPVREVVRLREEQAVVERRPVDRQATTGDLDTFKEGTMEIRESVEEPVVAKTARVVEEVRVGKQVREREQTIEDEVRRKDVDVQRLDGGRVEDRDRAVASDVTDPMRERRNIERGLEPSDRSITESERDPLDKTRKNL